MLEFIYKGQTTTLIKAVISKYPSLSYSHLRTVLRKKDVLVDGVRVKDDVKISDGSTIRLYTTIHTADNYEYKVDTVYEDDAIFIFNKPKGLEVEGDISLITYAKRLCSTSQAVHRLDINTDGLIIVAKNEKIADFLKIEIKNRRIEKHYVCAVYGRTGGAKRLESYLKKDAFNGMVKVYDKKVDGSVKIITEYTTIKSFSDYSVLDVNLITGRTHQIRAHLAYVGHPILGDGKYGTRAINSKFPFKKQALTAYKLTFYTEGELGYLYGKTFKIDNKLLHL